MASVQLQLRRESLLRLDPDLGAELDEAKRLLAERAVEVQVLPLERGDWAPPRRAPELGHLGYLIISGVMLRELYVAAHRSLEVLNSGDLVIPWQEDAASFVEARWTVLERARVAVLDRAAAERLGRFPGLVSVVTRRVMYRSRALAVYAAVAGMTGLEDRVLVLLWQLAERWGVRTEEGVRMPLRLTNRMLADLVGARRPSVSVTLSRLSDQGRVKRDPSGGWLLLGDAPSPREPPSVRPGE